MSDGSDITPPKDPADYRPKPLLSFTFWAMVAFAVLCVLAGVAIASLGPRLFAPKPAARSEAVPAPAEPVPATVAAPPAAPAAAPAAGPPAADVGRLTARVAVLENHAAHASQAAAAALAAGAVAEAAQGSGGFADEIAALRVAAPTSPELAALSRLAQAGAPSRAALAASFPDYAARAASAAHAPGDKAGLGARIVYALAKVVSLRRVGDVPGDAPDAILARAERAIADGDLDRAFRQLDRLPPEARDALAPWRARAERRAEIDRAVAALRTRALQDLAADQRAGA